MVVEITEQRQFESYDQLRETVCLVHERGMRVAVDDMGSGFAGLQRLVDVRPEVVKLDRGLTSEIDTDPSRRALVMAMRQFADDMGSPSSPRASSARTAPGAARPRHRLWPGLPPRATGGTALNAMPAAAALADDNAGRQAGVNGKGRPRRPLPSKR